MGMNPLKMTLIGIQPEKMETGLDLSATLEDKLEELLRTVLEKLREWGVAFTQKNTGEGADVPGHSV